ncbi:MAG: hypothetical protein LBB77_10750, partial [Treponema sp.]|nr:hypothetical protein [Treponema sp.]
GGVQYERVLTPKFSVGGGAYFNSLFFLFNNLGVEAMGRYYIWQGLYAQMGLGFGMRMGVGSGLDLYVVRGFLLDPTAGWKIDLGRPGGFFIEPLVSVPIVLGKKDYDWWGEKDKFGVGVGVRIAFGMGYAF